MHIGQCWSLVHQVIQPHLLKRFLEHISNDMAGGKWGKREESSWCYSWAVGIALHHIVSSIPSTCEANSRCSVEATFHGTRPEPWPEDCKSHFRPCDQSRQHSDAPRFVTQILNSGLDPQMCARASVNSAQVCCLVHNGAGFLASWSLETLGSDLMCHFCRWLAIMAAEPMLLGSYFDPY